MFNYGVRVEVKDANWGFQMFAPGFDTPTEAVAYVTEACGKIATALGFAAAGLIVGEAIVIDGGQ